MSVEGGVVESWLLMELTSIPAFVRIDPSGPDEIEVMRMTKAAEREPIRVSRLHFK
jgi:hypothetical protein